MKKLLPILLALLSGAARAASLPIIASAVPAAPIQSSAISGLTANIAAATATANFNSVCTALYPYYWEIGDKNGLIASGSVGASNGNNSVLPSGTVINSSTKLTIASGSKWIAGSYVLQVRGSLSALSNSNLTPTNTSPAPGDVDYLHFASGYTYMGDDGKSCPHSTYPTINACVSGGVNSTGQAFNTQNPANIGMFTYDSGHLENQAANLMGSYGNVNFTKLATTMWSAFGITTKAPTYTSPLLAGGLYASTDQYTAVLRRMLATSPTPIVMGSALSAFPVCTYAGGDYSFLNTSFGGIYSSAATSSCVANANSVIPELWGYGLAHWIEFQFGQPPTTVAGDGAFSSAGSYGVYPSVDASRTYYIIVSRNQTPATVTNGVFITQQGYATATCGRLIRRAFICVAQQTGSLPSC